MNVREKFRHAAEKIRLDFKSSAGVKHSGGKGSNREDLVRDQLRQLLPSRYALGKGEIITNAEVSGECDIVIYDSTQCPQLLLSNTHATYPVETVFGIISVKSVLSSGDLRDAYQNIRSAKTIAPRVSFSLDVDGGGLRRGFAPPPLLGVVFAFEAGRTLEAVAKQVQALDAELPSIDMRPDFVVVLDQGIVGPPGMIRTYANKLRIPAESQRATIRRTGPYTWLRFFLQLLQELNAITLMPFTLEPYLNLPEVVAGRQVRYHDGLPRSEAGDAPRRLTAIGVEKIARHCEAVGPMPLQQYALKYVGKLPENHTDRALATPVYVYNPRGISPTEWQQWKLKQPHTVRPIFVLIDGVNYAIDLCALADDDWEEHDDPHLHEAFA